MGSNKIIVGVNDLQSQFPDIAAEAYGWDPITASAGSNQKKDWKCSKGHIYSSVVRNRTSRGDRCPICSGKNILEGFNDLKTKFPDIAAEAYEWDPVTVSAGSNQKKDWKCSKGHIYTSAVDSRTIRKTGCPFCSGQQVLSGFNDLKTKFPDIAAEAFRWNPVTVFYASTEKKDWKCNNKHIYCTTIRLRTLRKTGCPICSGNKVLSGFNDLKTKFPDIAAEAYKWDPSTIVTGTHQKKDWRCSKGHIYASAVTKRSSGQGCPYCSGNKVLSGFNDLKTKFPDIAAEAYGWDPTTVSAGTDQKRNWKCNKGHIYSALIRGRTDQKSGCPFCLNQKVLAGFNDLKTKFPDIAAEAHGWDPTTVVAGTHQKKDWKCSKGHIYTSAVDSRTYAGTGCSVCAEYGFNPEKDAWFYLMQRPGEQQIGITNDLKKRLQVHERNGWVLLEHTTVPSKGQKVLDTENAFKKWLKKEIGVMEGTTENWSTTKMEVQSLAELKARSGIETDLF